MFPSLLTPEIVDRIRRWDELKRWERREIGQTLRRMGLSYRDPAMTRLFVNWVDRYLGIDASKLTVQLHLHDGQDEAERKAFWSRVTSVPIANFIKTFVKPEGTGHRKNVLYQGIATVRVPRSSALLQKVLCWSDAVAELYADLRYTAAGR